MLKLIMRSPLRTPYMRACVVVVGACEVAKNLLAMPQRLPADSLTCIRPAAVCPPCLSPLTWHTTMRPRLAACLLALCCAFATASPLPAPVSVLSRSLLYEPEAHFSSHELVLRAHRAGLTRGLQEEFLCTSLSGPGCLSGAAHQPERWTRVRNDSVRPASPPVAEVFLLADARTLLALLSTGADWLVLFYSPDCEECEAAAHAVRAAAPALALRSPLRYLAVDCAAESALVTCAAHGVTRTPELHLYLGQALGVTFHSTPFQPVRTGEQAGAAEGWTAEAVLQFESNGRSPSRQVRAAARVREKEGDIINLKVKGQVRGVGARGIPRRCAHVRVRAGQHGGALQGPLKHCFQEGASVYQFTRARLGL